MPEPFFLEYEGHCGSLTYLDGTYWSLDDTTVKPVIAVLKRDIMTMSPHSPDYYACEELIQGLEEMIAVYEKRVQSDDYAG